QSGSGSERPSPSVKARHVSLSMPPGYQAVRLAGSTGRPLDPGLSYYFSIFLVFCRDPPVRLPEPGGVGWVSKEEWGGSRRLTPSAPPAHTPAREGTERMATIEDQPAMSAPPPAELPLRLLAAMLRIRRFEERTEELYRAGELPGFVHLSIGQEACAAGACAALRRDDYITSTHRGHGHCIAKGADTRKMMAELYAKATGVCKGKGGSMHIADFSVGM